MWCTRILENTLPDGGSSARTGWSQPFAHWRIVIKSTSFIVSLAAFGAGLAVGLVGATVVIGNQFAESLLILKQLKLVESEERSLAAYKNESGEIGIYALSSHLKTIAEIEEHVGDNAGLLSEGDILFDKVVTHGRLAKLYSQIGQDSRSRHHVPQALKHAKGMASFAGISDETGLMDVVARMDQ